MLNELETEKEKVFVYPNYFVVQCMGMAHIWIDLACPFSTKEEALARIEWEKVIDDTPPKRTYLYRIVEREPIPDEEL